MRKIKLRKPNRRVRALLGGKRRKKHGSGWVKHRHSPLCMGYFYAQAREQKLKKKNRPPMFDTIHEVFNSR
jgi:hypothetical protein